MIYNSTSYVKKSEPASSFVVAMFERGAVSFKLSATATLADIADRVSAIGALHIGAPIAIDVTFNPTARDRPNRATPYLGSPELLW